MEEDAVGPPMTNPLIAIKAKAVEEDDEGVIATTTTMSPTTMRRRKKVVALKTLISCS